MLFDDLQPKEKPMATAPAQQVRPVSRRNKLASQVYFVLMISGLSLGVFLAPVWGGVVNVLLLLLAAYSGYRVFTGPSPVL